MGSGGPEGDATPAMSGRSQSRASAASGARGKAISLGPLSVPLGWSLAAPRLDPVPPAPPAISVDAATSVDAAPPPPAGSPRGRTFQQGLMAMVAPPDAKTNAADPNTESEENAEARHAETRFRDDADGHDVDGRGPDVPTGISVPQGQTATVPSGGTVTLGHDTAMRVNGGSVTVVGTGPHVLNVPVTVNVGSTVKTLSRCDADGAVIPADTHVTATSSPIALTQYRHAKVEVQLVSGSVTTHTDTQVGEVVTGARQNATAVVGAAEASVTNTEGTVTITVP